MPPQPRELTDDYRLERILASSRGASILAASALSSGQAVVVKLINVPAAASSARAAAAAARFTATAAALAAVRHPNLPRVIDSGITPDGGAFLVMERLEGIGFDAHTLAAGDSPGQVLPLLAQALAGLEELARHGLAHLNVAPENLFLTPATATPGAIGIDGGASPTVKLLGLGTPIFHLGETTGEAESARFRAPELSLPASAAAAFADWHADCYSLALTACNALGATVAFGETSGPIVQMPLALSFELENDEALRQILERCLRRVPAQRPTHAEIRAAFGLALGAPLAAPAVAAEAARPWAEMPATTASSSSTNPVGTPTPPSPSSPFVSSSPSSPLSQSSAQLSPPAAPSAVPNAAPIASATASPPTALAAFTNATGTPPAESWRTALNSQSPAAELPSWRSAKPFDPPRPEEPLAEARPSAAERIHPLAAEPGDPSAAEPGNPSAAERGDPSAATAEFAPVGPSERYGSDSFLDLFAVPSSLPDLFEGPAMDAGAATGEAGSAALSATEMAAALGLDRSAGPDGAGDSPFGSSLWEPEPAASREAAVPAETTARKERSGAAAPTLPTAPTVPAAPGATAGISVPAANAAPQGGEMLSAVDDLLGALPPAALPTAGTATTTGTAQRPGKSAAGAAQATVGSPARSAAAGPPAARKPAALLAFVLGLPRLLLLGVAALLVLILAAGAFLFFRLHAAPASSLATATPADATSPPPEIPGRTAAAKFFDAKSYQILGRESDGRVRQALRELSYGEQGELGENGCRELRAIEQTLGAAALETAPQDLTNGLRNGDLGLLEAVAGVATEQDVPAGQKMELERAKSLVKVYDEAQGAAARGDHAEVLAHFRTLEGLSRTLHDPLSLREKAAAALESEAGALAQDGKYDQAIGRLEPLRRDWPERSGIKDLLKTYESAAANETAQLALLDEVPNILRRRKPSEALDRLRTVKPTPHLAARTQDAIQQLEAQLAQLDAQPPQVTLRDDFPLDYSRGQVVTLSFRVTDDYQVKSVKMFARPQGGAMREMPLQKVGLAYTIEIPPAFHQNGTVDFYVVATDLSGHEGTLGSREKPLQLKRRQGFERLLH